MKLRKTFNDGKNFSHYAFVVFKVGLVTTYLCSGVLMFGAFYMNASEHMRDTSVEIIHDMKKFYFSDDEQYSLDCMNCDEID